MAEAAGTAQRTQLRLPGEKTGKSGPEASSDLSGMQALPKEGIKTGKGVRILFTSHDATEVFPTAPISWVFNILTLRSHEMAVTGFRGSGCGLIFDTAALVVSGETARRVLLRQAALPKNPVTWRGMLPTLALNLSLDAP